MDEGEQTLADDVNNDVVEYDDYSFPILGIIYSIRRDRVHIIYHIKRYAMEGPDQLLDMDINCDTEEHADAMALEIGDILDKMHLHERLTIDQNTIKPQNFGELI